MIYMKWENLKEQKCPKPECFGLLNFKEGAGYSCGLCRFGISEGKMLTIAGKLPNLEKDADDLLDRSRGHKRRKRR